MASLRIALASVITTSALIVACTSNSDHPPPSAGGTYTGGPVGSSGTVGEGGVDGGDAQAGEAGANLCSSAVQQGATVDELNIGDTAPPPLGGTIAPGTYVLSELDEYGPAPAEAGTDPSTGFVGRSTLVVAGNTISIIGARGMKTATLPPDTVIGETFVIAGTSLQTTSVCPTAGTQKAIPYSAVGGGLALFVDTKHRELYAKQ